MCAQNYNVWRMVGKDLNTLNGALGDLETTPIINSNDGDVIGLSVAENYSRIVLASLLLTIEVDGAKPLVNVPLTQLLPDGERFMWPLKEKILKGSKPKITLTHRNNTTAAANPVVLICHHAPLNDCVTK